MSFPTFEYEGTQRYVYGDDGATFIPVCTQCGCFVKADKTIFINEANGPKEPNATCKKHGRVAMIFEGYY